MKNQGLKTVLGVVLSALAYAESAPGFTGDSIEPVGWAGARFSYIMVHAGSEAGHSVEAGYSDVDVRLASVRGRTVRKQLLVGRDATRDRRTLLEGVRLLVAPDAKLGRDLPVRWTSLGTVAVDQQLRREEAALAETTVASDHGSVSIRPELKKYTTWLTVDVGGRLTRTKVPMVRLCSPNGCAMGRWYYPLSAIVRVNQSPDGKYWALMGTSQSLSRPGWSPPAFVQVIQNPTRLVMGK